MKMTLQELLGKRESLMKLLNADLPPKVSYRLSKAVDIVNKEYEFFAAEQRKLLEKFGKKTKNEEGQDVVSVDPTLIGPNKSRDHVKEMTDLLNEEVEITTTPISMDLLPEDSKMSAIDMNNLVGFLIEVDEEKPKKEEPKKEEEKKE